MSKLYEGYVPMNVARDAKYSIRHGAEGDMEVQLIYRLSARDVALLATQAHPRLVSMVNEVKVAVQGVMGGVFYINEYGHVLVKTGAGECFYAGRYDDDLLEFDFEGEKIGPNPGAHGSAWPSLGRPTRRHSLHAHGGLRQHLLRVREPPECHHASLSLGRRGRFAGAPARTATRAEQRPSRRSGLHQREQPLLCAHVGR